MPKIVLTDEQIALFGEEDRKHAVKNEGDGTWNLDVRPTATIENFRDNNIALKREQESAIATLTTLMESMGMEKKEIASAKEFDLDAATAMLTELLSIQKKVNDGKLVADTSLEEAITQRVTEMRSESDKRINQLTTEVKNLNTKLGAKDTEMDNYVRDNEITMAVLAQDSEVNPSALPDVLSRARNVFKVDGNRKLVAKDETGATLFGADATSPLSVGEWLKLTVEKSPHLGKTSRGGGSDNTGGAGGAGGTPLETLAQTSDTGAFVAARLKSVANTPASFGR